MKTLFYAIITILLIDFLGFIWWALSGQIPQDGYYLGTITTHILRAILF